MTKIWKHGGAPINRELRVYTAEEQLFIHKVISYTCNRNLALCSGPLMIKRWISALNPPPVKVVGCTSQIFDPVKEGLWPNIYSKKGEGLQTFQWVSRYWKFICFICIDTKYNGVLSIFFRGVPWKFRLRKMGGSSILAEKQRKTRCKAMHRSLNDTFNFQNALDSPRVLIIDTSKFCTKVRLFMGT